MRDILIVVLLCFILKQHYKMTFFANPTKDELVSAGVNEKEADGIAGEDIDFSVLADDKVDAYMGNLAFQRQAKYIKDCLPIAQSEMKKFGIPVSIKLAQAILEGECDQSPICKKTQNRFGIKCGLRHCKDNKHCYRSKSGARWRKYPSRWGSFRGHSLFLKEHSRYASLFKKKDAKSWAYGLQKTGYCSDYGYPEKLLAIIAKHDLTKYDK